MQKSEAPIIFIVGNSRSGTTMMGGILGNNKEIFTFKELHFFEQYWVSKDKDLHLSMQDAINLVSRLIRIQRKGYLCRTSTDKYLKEAEDIVNLNSHKKLNSSDLYKKYLFYETDKNKKIIPCEQTPRYVLYISEILDLFPNARIINMVRDPRDVLLSQKRKWGRRFFDPNMKNKPPLTESCRTWVNYHPITISKLWNVSISAANKFRNHRQILSLRFEDFIKDPEVQVSKVCDFIKVTFNREMLEIPQSGSSIYENQPDNIRGISKNRTGLWQKGGLNSTEIYINQKINSSLMEQYGYVVTNANPNYFTLVWYMISFPLKILMAFALNLNRIKNIRETIKRRLKA